MESNQQALAITWKQFEAQLKNLAFDRIIQQLQEKQFWSKRSANIACLQYQRFLYLIKKYGDTYQLPPSKEIDECWHQHVLCTKQYHHDCQILFGKYLHHYPFLKKEAIGLLSKGSHPFDLTQQLYFQEFGEYIHEIRWIMLPKRIWEWNRVRIKKIMAGTQ